MEQVPIKIRILDKEYTIRAAAEEAELLTEAASFLNEEMLKKREEIGISDKQDLLSFVAFDSFYQRLKAEKAEDKISKRLDALSSLIGKTLE